MSWISAHIGILFHVALNYAIQTINSLKCDMVALIRFNLIIWKFIKYNSWTRAFNTHIIYKIALAFLDEPIRFILIVWQFIKNMTFELHLTLNLQNSFWVLRWTLCYKLSWQSMPSKIKEAIFFNNGSLVVEPILNLNSREWSLILQKVKFGFLCQRNSPIVL